MRILFVNPGGDAAGGAERSLVLLIRELVRRGHELGVVTLASGDAGDVFASAGAIIVADGLRHELGGVRRHGSAADLIRGASRTLGPAVSAARAIRSQARSFAADLIHTNGLRAHLLTPLLARASPVVWSLRERPPGALARAMVRAAARAAVAITAPSLFAAELASGCRRPVYVIPNPVEPAAPADRRVARASLGLPAGRPVVAVLAHLHPTKGQHVAIAAWRRLRAPRPLLVLAGGDLYGQASTAYRTALQQSILSGGLTGDVLLVGLVADPAQLYAASDLVLHPALHPEGFGRSVAEAQVAGVPVVATSIGAAVELIEHGRSGMLAPPGNGSALAEAVSLVLEDPALQRRLRAGGLALAARYRPESHAASMESVYRAVTA